MKNQTESNDNPSNFIRAIIEKNIRHKLYENKNWGLRFSLLEGKVIL